MLYPPAYSNPTSHPSRKGLDIQLLQRGKSPIRTATRGGTVRNVDHGPPGMTRTTSSNGARISRYRRESCVNATHLACTKCSGNEGLSARPEVGAGVDLDAPTKR